MGSITIGRKRMYRPKDGRIILKNINAEVVEQRRMDKQQAEQELVEEFKENPDTPFTMLSKEYGMDPRRVLRKYGIEVPRRHKTPEEIKELENKIVMDWERRFDVGIGTFQIEYKRCDIREILERHGVSVPPLHHRRVKPIQRKYWQERTREKRSYKRLTPEETEELERAVVDEWLHGDDTITMHGLQYKYHRDIRKILEKYGIAPEHYGRRLQKFYS